MTRDSGCYTKSCLRGNNGQQGCRFAVRQARRRHVSMPLSQFLGREQGDGAELKPQVRRRHTAGEQQRAAGLRRAVSPRHAVRRRQQRRRDASAGIGERSWYECRPHLHCTARCWSCGRGLRAALRLPTGLAGRAQRHGVSLSCGHVRGQAGGGCVHGAGDLRRW